MSYNHTLTMYRDDKSDVVFHHYKEDGESHFEISKWKDGDSTQVVSFDADGLSDFRGWMLGEQAGFVTIEDIEGRAIRLASTSSGKLQFRKEKENMNGYRKPFVVLDPAQTKRLKAWFKRTKTNLSTEYRV